MQQSIGLTKDNVMLITTDMGKPTEFHGIEMKFLKRSIVYMFRVILLYLFIIYYFHLGIG